MTEVNETQDVVVKPSSFDDLKRKMKVTGTVTRLELYGAFIDIGLDNPALIHISQLGEERVNRVTDVLKEGEEVTVWVDKIDAERQQVMVTRIEPLAVEWSDLENKQVYTGKITRLENFGAFVDIGAEREGLVHISELSHDYVKHPTEVLNVGDEAQVQVLGFSKRKRRIDLSIKALLEKPEPEVTVPMQDNGRIDMAELEEEDEYVELPTAMEVALREAMGNDAIDSFKGDKRGKKKKSRRKEENKRRNSRKRQREIMNRTLRMQELD